MLMSQVLSQVARPAQEHGGDEDIDIVTPPPLSSHFERPEQGQLIRADLERPTSKPNDHYKWTGLADQDKKSIAL